MTPIVDMLREASIWARDAELANDCIVIVEFDKRKVAA